MAGHYKAMSEFLLRGYNVAVPAVDVGDDVFVVDDREGTLWRVQVKTATAEMKHSHGRTVVESSYNVSRAQLVMAKPAELFYMLMLFHEGDWQYIMIPRPDLLEIRETFENAPSKGGRPRTAAGDTLGLVVRWDTTDATAWDASLEPWRNKWLASFPPIDEGPGAVGGAGSPTGGETQPDQNPGKGAPD